MKTRVQALLLSVLLISPAVRAEDSVIAILDGSNSMWGRMDGKEKIVIAREVMTEVLSDISSAAQVGLAAYGHRSKEDCDDIQMLLPVGEHSGEALSDAVNSVTPTGKTPITKSIELVARENPSHIILVSDGKETCNGDPCAAVEALKRGGAQFKVHVVGFDVTAEESEQLRCIAEAGEGRYTDAGSAEELVTALGQIKEDVKKKSTPQIRFVQHWQLTSEDGEYEGSKARHMVLDGKPMLQLVNTGAVNVGFAVPAEYGGEQAATHAFFAEGRGPVCRLVGKPGSFKVRFEEVPEGWVKGTFGGMLGCPDSRPMPVEGSFLVRAN